MDKKTLEKLGAIVKEFTISYERKVTDGNYGSVGGQFFVTCDVGKGKDPEIAMNAAYEWLKLRATENLKPSFEAVRVPPETPDVPYEDPQSYNKVGFVEPEETREVHTDDGKYTPDGMQKWCPVHELWMKKWEKEGRSWFSHKVDDKWCKGEFSE